MRISTKLIMTEWPPNDGVKPGDERFDELFSSIKENGILEPITINRNWMVIDGNHRLSAARLLDIPYIEVKIWTGSEMLI